MKLLHKLLHALQTIPQNISGRHHPLFALSMIAVSGVLVIGAIAGIVVGAGRARSRSVPNKIPVAAPASLFLQNSLVPPPEPGVPDDYLLYRERKSMWTQQEVDRWFIVPNAEMLQELHNSNEKMISDLLKAAP
jgi:hypothetical protein